MTAVETIEIADCHQPAPEFGWDMIEALEPDEICQGGSSSYRGRRLSGSKHLTMQDAA